MKGSDQILWRNNVLYDLFALSVDDTDFFVVINGFHGNQWWCTQMTTTTTLMTMTCMFLLSVKSFWMGSVSILMTNDSIIIRSVVDVDAWCERAFMICSSQSPSRLVSSSPFLQHRLVSWNLEYETLFQSLVLYSSSRLMLNTSNS